MPVITQTFSKFSPKLGGRAKGAVHDRDDLPRKVTSIQIVVAQPAERVTEVEESPEWFRVIHDMIEDLGRSPHLTDIGVR